MIKGIGNEDGGFSLKNIGTELISKLRPKEVKAETNQGIQLQGTKEDELVEVDFANFNENNPLVKTPSDLNRNYYSIYAHLMNSSNMSQLNSIVQDPNMWSPDSCSTSPELLAQKLNKIFSVKGSAFAGKGPMIVQAALSKGINPELFAAKIMAECDLGTNVKGNNVGGIRQQDGSYKEYTSIDQGIGDMAWLLAYGEQYNLANGSKSMADVDSVYAPGNAQYSQLLAMRLLAIQNFEI